MKVTRKEMVERIHELHEQNGEMYRALKWFCDRVEKGEIRSKKTYTRFKEILEFYDW